MSKYEPHFDIDYQRGLIGEKLVGSYLEALAGSRIEVKTDSKAWLTGNVYVETHQKNRKGDWVKSGINITQAEWYCFAAPDGNGFISIKTQHLKELAIKSPKSQTNVENENTRPTVGRLVKVANIVEVVMANTQRK